MKVKIEIFWRLFCWPAAYSQRDAIDDDFRTRNRVSCRDKKLKNVKSHVLN